MRESKNKSMIPYQTRSLVRVSPDTEGRISPAVTITETPSSYVITLDMPGADRSAIGVQVEGHLMKVRSGILDTDTTEPRTDQSDRERKIYYREFTVLDGIDTNRADAVYEDGVLTITLQKSENSRTREISIS